MNFYSADFHLCHEAVIKMCARPFSNAAEMNDAIIRNFAARMGGKDDLWFIGDFAFAKEAGGDRSLVRSMFNRIPGRKHLIRGNHEKQWIEDLPWHSKNDFLEIKENGRRVVMFHYPMVTWPGSRHGSIQLFGHVHDNWLGQRNSVNVGVDHWDFRPVTLDEASARAADLPVSDLFLACEPGLDLLEE